MLWAYPNGGTDRKANTMTTSTAVYTVSNDAREITVYATADKDDAVSYSQINADRDLRERPNAATPHYVIRCWGCGGTDKIHIYGKN